MIKLLQREEINDEKWNEAVMAKDSFRHYGLSYFLDATANRWLGFVKDDYEWVWPIPVKSSPLPQVIQPLLAQQLGPFPAENTSADEIEWVWRFLAGRYWKMNVKFCDQLTKLPMESLQHRNIQLFLGKDYNQLASGYNRNAKSNIRKAELALVSVHQSTDYNSEAVSLFREGRGREIRELDDRFYEHVQNIYKAFEERGQAETWVATTNGSLLGAVMLLKTRGRLLNFFTAASLKARDCGAMHVIFDALIKHHAGRADMLDFEGSDDDNLAYFYRSFGGTEQVYLQAQTGWYPPVLNRMLP